MTVPTVVIREPTGPAGAPLVVLGNSLGTSTLLWNSTATLLGSHYRVAAFDLPGHGASPAATEPFTVGEIALAVLNAVDALGEREFHYAGVSLGGAIGLELLLAAPSRVLSAAIICSGAKIGTSDSWIQRAAAVRSQGTASLVVPSASRWFAPGSIERLADDSGRLLHTLRDADDGNYAWCAEALALHDVRAHLSSITAPVLAIWGEHDLVTPEPNAAEVAAGVHRGSIERVADAAHLVPFEQPAVTASLLARFFEGAT